MRYQDIIRHGLAAASAFLRWAKTPAVQRIGLAAAAVIFVLGIYWSWRDVSPKLSQIDYRPLFLLTFGAVPFIILSNVLELFYAARLVGASLRLSACFKISILSSAANLLPLPAGPVMRAVAVVDGGGSGKAGAISVLFPALVWLGIGFVFSGAAMTGVGQTLWGAVFCTAGLAVLLAAGAIMRQAHLVRAAAARIFIVKVCGALFDIAALALALALIGEPVTALQAMALSASGPFGAAVSVVPAGLGIRELASSGLGALVGIPAAAAFLAPSLYRLVYLAVLAVLSPIALALRIPAAGRRDI